jgi:hypothetical protein
MKVNLFKEWKGFWIRKIYIWMLMLFQLLVYFTVGFAPAITLRILYSSINYIANISDWGWTWQGYVVGAVLGLIYLLHVVVHHNNKYNNLIMIILVILSFASTILGYYSIFHYAFWSNNQAFMSEILIFSISNLPIYIGLLVIFLPFPLALFLSGSGHSFIYMYKSFITYLLFLHVLIAWFGSYSYARLWDISWGNRPSDEINDLSEKVKDKMTKKFKRQNLVIIIALLILNVIVFFLPLDILVIIITCFFSISLVEMFFSAIYMCVELSTRLSFRFNRFFRCCCGCCIKNKYDPTKDGMDSLDEFSEIYLTTSSEDV